MSQGIYAVSWRGEEWTTQITLDDALFRAAVSGDVHARASIIHRFRTQVCDGRRTLYTSDGYRELYLTDYIHWNDHDFTITRMCDTARQQAS